MGKKTAPFWLWPNLLSLDAPLVAVAWLWILKKALYLHYIEPMAYWVLFGVVWCVYVVDRIIDVYRGFQEVEGEASWRHRFHWKYRWWLLGGVAIVGSFCLHQALYVLPQAMLSAGIVGGIFILKYLIVAMFQRKDSIPYIKNFMAGMIFAFGVAVPAQIYQANLSMDLGRVFYHLTDSSDVSFLMGLRHTLSNMGVFYAQYILTVLLTWETVTFGLLCMMNIMAIDLWERSRQSDDPEVKATHEMVLTLGLIVVVGFALLYTYKVADAHSKPYYYAIMTGAGLLHLINRQRSRFTLDAQRVLADLALLIPVPVYMLLSSSV